MKDWSPWRRVGVTLAALVAALLAAPAVAQHPAAEAAAVDDPLCTLASAPDMNNIDYGNLRKLDTWHPGDENSMSPWVRNSMATVLDDITAKNPNAVMVAGDLVEGHWGVDDSGQGTFGPTDTLAQRRDAIRRAGNFYYREWKQRLAKRGFNTKSELLVAVGDHEIGDNPWSGPGGYGAGDDFKRDSMGVYKNTWAKRFTINNDGTRKYARRPVGTNYANTAYAAQPKGCPGVLVVTVDVFWKRDGDVHADMSQGQVDWLDKVLTNTTADTVIVQGHTPVLGPVRTSHSSGLMFEGGRASAFWQTLVEHNVDYYFAGEVHDVTAKRNGGVVQISHGGLIRFGELNYMTVDIYADHVELETRRFHAEANDSKGTMWSTHDAKRSDRYVVYQPGSYVTGTMAVGAGGATGTGELAFGYSGRKKKR